MQFGRDPPIGRDSSPKPRVIQIAADSVDSIGPDNPFNGLTNLMETTVSDKAINNSIKESKGESGTRILDQIIRPPPWVH